MPEDHPLRPPAASPPHADEAGTHAPATVSQPQPGARAPAGVAGHATPGLDQAATADYRATPVTGAAGGQIAAEDCLGLLAAYRAGPLPADGPPGRFGRFTIHGVAGRGGFGVVFRATDPDLGREVALKLPRPDALWTPQLRQRFLFEGQAAAILDHPNIVAVHEAGEVEGVCYLATAFVDGPTLAGWLDAHPGPVPARRAADLVATLADAVEHAHRRGVLHRDLKPGNVLLAPDGTAPRVADFGLARLADQAEGGLTHTGAVMGTPPYMAPEQAAGDARRVGTHTDVYALGVILYELLTRTRPIEGADRSETLRLVITADPPAVRGRRPDAPRDLEGVCLKCLAKDPARRYPTARELAADLRRFLAGEPVLARRPGPARRALSWCRRYPAAAALLVSLTAGIAATAGLTAFALGERDRANGNAAAAEQNAAAARENAATAIANAAVADAARRQATEQKVRAEAELARSLLAGVRESRVSRPHGWTWDGVGRLRTALELKTTGVDPVEVRGLAAACLGGADVRPAGAIGEGVETVGLAFSPDGARLAVAPFRSGFVCPVHVYDVRTRAKVATHSFPTAGAIGSAELGKWDGANRLAFSPDGRWLVAGTRLGSLHRWDLTAEKPRTVSWKAHPSGTSTRGLAFTPDGRWLVSCGAETWRWDVANGWAGTRLPALDEGTHDAAFSADGRVRAITWGELTLHDGAGWTPRPRTGPLAHTVAVSPDGRTVAAQHGGDVHVLDAADGRPRRTLVLPLATGEAGLVRFSPDGSLLVASGGLNRVYVFEVSTGRLLTEIRVPDRREPVVRFSPDGRLLAVAAENRTLLYEVRTGDAGRTVAHHPDPVRAIDFTPAGELVCLTEHVLQDRAVGHAVTVWDLATGRQTATRVLTSAHPDRRFLPFAGSVAVHPAGDRVFTVSSPVGPAAAALRGRDTLLPLLDRHDMERPVVFRPEELALPAAGAELRDDPRAPTGRAVRLTPGASGEGVRVRFPEALRKGKRDGWMTVAAVRVERKDAAGPGIASGVRASPDFAQDRPVPAAQIPDDGYQLYLLEGTHARMLLGSHEWMDVVVGAPPTADAVEAVWVGGVFLYPVWAADWPHDLRGTDRPYDLLTVSPDGSRVWATHSNDWVVSWDAATLAGATRWKDQAFAVVRGLSPQIRAVAAGDRVVLVGTQGGVLHALSAKTGKAERSRDKFGGIRAAALDATETVAVVGTERGQVRVVRVADLEVLADLPPHAAGVEAVALSRDAALLVTASLDQTIAVWRKADGGYERVVSLPAGGTDVVSVRLSPDGTKLAVLGRGDRGVRVWDLARLRDRCTALGAGW